MRLVRESMWPVSEWSGIARDFSVDLQEAQLGCLTSVLEVTRGLPHSRRTRSDVDNSADSSYCLFTTDQRVDWAHNGHNERLHSGDVVLLGQGEHDSHMANSGFRSNVLKLPAHWLESWLPDPELLAGRNIPRDSRWGRVLSPMLRQLTPEFAAAPSLPHEVLVDQVGATLALIAAEVDARLNSDLLRRIQDCIRQRCAEPNLTAAEVAASLNLPPLSLHRALGAGDATFASLLLDERIKLAQQMMTLPSFNRLSTAELAHRAGFLSVSHFTRVLRKRTGRTARELRRPTH
jgi:AraC-like DNA-binding protein